MLRSGLRAGVSVGILLAMLLPRHGAASLDLGYRGWGISIGNAKRVTGVRINGVDRHVERVNGLNLTLWNPHKNPRAAFNGATLGLIGPKAGHLHGLAAGGVWVQADTARGLLVGGLGAATRQTRGLVVGGLAIGVQRVTGAIATLGLAVTEEEVQGLAMSGLTAGGNLSGIAGIAGARARGVFIAGVGSGAGERLSGIALSLGGIGAGEHLRGIALPGIGVGAGKSLEGFAVGIGGVGTGHKIRGVALGGLAVLSPDIEGVATGALNGAIVEEVNLEDFLKIRKVNKRFVGLSVGLINYTRKLKGVQLGLINYAGNSPKWLRLLPLVNVHL